MDIKDPTPAPALFRKKPVEIRAILWNGSNLDAVLDFCEGCATYEAMSSGGGNIVIETLESNREAKTRHAATVGDFIIRGVKGEFYPCKPDIFAVTYDPAVPAHTDLQVPALEVKTRVNNDHVESMIEQLEDEDGDYPPESSLANALRDLLDLRSHLSEAEGGRDTEWLEQAWNEIYGTMHDTMLNNGQRRAFILSILKGQLANPPSPSTDTGGLDKAFRTGVRWGREDLTATADLLWDAFSAPELNCHGIPEDSAAKKTDSVNDKWMIQCKPCGAVNPFSANECSGCGTSFLLAPIPEPRSLPQEGA